MPKNPNPELTPIQRGMVFHKMVEPGSAVDIEQIEITLGAPVDARRLQSAWQAVVARHRVLHSRVVETAPGDCRLTTVAGFQPELAMVEIADPDFDAGCEAWLTADRARGFDLMAEVPLRLSLLRRPGHPDRCVWTFHHILLDGRSFSDVLVELWDAYDALLSGQDQNLAARPDQSDFIDWLHGLDHTESTAYWRKLLSGIDEATPFPEAAASVPTSATRRVTRRRLSAQQTEALERWVRDNGVTL
ncbi:MAG: hypothetical protein KY442_08360, partial [Proteobacteria bacterium]|nr:hypothetical protein [Pseudomonadota bacterium]